ncbi:MAG: hypothetical protein H7844_12335 [Nitrospirae bacterium YQR-1]
MTINSSMLKLTHLRDLLKKRPAQMLLTALALAIAMIITLPALKSKTRKLSESLSNYNHFITLAKEYKRGELNKRGDLSKGIDSYGVLKQIEDMLSELNLKDRLSSIKSAGSTARGEYVSESAELKLADLSLNETVNVLYALRGYGTGIIIKSFKLKKSFSGQNKFELSMEVMSLKHVAGAFPLNR